MSPHNFPHPIASVAIIGAGPSGLPLARHLLSHNLHVRVFERQPQPGGIWNYEPSPRPSPPDVKTPPSQAAFEPVARGRQGSRVYVDRERLDEGEFGSYNPMYWSLSTNLPTATNTLKDYPYPPDTPTYVSHTTVATYLHNYAKHFGVDEITEYGTRVELVEKVQAGGRGYWRVRLRSLEDAGEDGLLKESIWEEIFDAVIVATGPSTAPLIPRFPGLTTWTNLFPSRIIHSSSYRRPEPYLGGTVLIVGIGTSAVDIARDIAPFAKKIWMVGRPIRGPESYKRLRRLQRFVLPSVAEVVPEILEFAVPWENGFEGVEGDDGIKNGRVELVDGRALTGITHVIFATGYQHSFPFLPQFHADPDPRSNHNINNTLTHLPPTIPTSPAPPIVTDGTTVHNLFRSSFYIPDPTLSFIGLCAGTSSFSFFEYQSIALARVYSGLARLPGTEAMWEWYAHQVTAKGAGRFLHWLGPGEEGERGYVRDTVEWLNMEAQLLGGVAVDEASEEEGAGLEPVEGHTPEWVEASEGAMLALGQRYGLNKAQVAAVLSGSVVDDGIIEVIPGYESKGHGARDEMERKVRVAMLRRNGT